MKFYDTLIDSFQSSLKSFDLNEYYDLSDFWQEDEHQKIIMMRDSAFELDGYGLNLVTSQEITDGVVIVGNDLNNIKDNTRFSRVCVVQIDDVDDEQKAYNHIRKIEYIKYHFFPTGYMMRTSSQSFKEKVRVSSDSIKNGISFKNIGNLFISKLKENPYVKAVKVYFITDSGVDYSFLADLSRQANDITKTLDHVMSTVNFDCNACNLKPVCDQVEGMRELHFKGRMG